jgi:GNAT superfamily N-acetyltransferase
VWERLEVVDALPSPVEPGRGELEVTIGPEPFDAAGCRWVVARAEAELEERYGFVAPTERGLTGAEFDPPTGAFLVARSINDQTPVGGVGLRRIREGTAEVKRLWVLPEHRRAGIAAALMGEIEDVARRLGYATLRLETGSGQPEAVALYDRFGWLRTDAEWDGTPVHPGSIRFTKALR